MANQDDEESAMTIPTITARTTRTTVTVVHSAACHFCEDAIVALSELSQDYPLAIETIDAAEPRGEELMRLHRAPMYPLVLVNGNFFSVGRLPRKKFHHTLAQLSTVQ